MPEIITLIISIITLIAVGVIAIIVFKNKGGSVDTSGFNKEIGKLSNQITSLEKNFEKDIKLAVQNEMLSIQNTEQQNQELTDKKLQRFNDNIITNLNTRFEHINTELSTKMAEINKKVEDKLHDGFVGTTEAMAQVRERLQTIDDAQKNIENLSKDVVSLRNVLEGNQTRGQYGEYQLSMVLHSVFGDTKGCYEEQFVIKTNKDGSTVRADAIVHMPEPNKMICIDSKFPFQNYERMFETDDQKEKEDLKKVFASDVKKHITTIKDKYIIEGKTSQNAIIFIPNDGIFAFIHHELIDIVNYAREKAVIITSPSTLPAILATINMVRIETERAKNVKVIGEELAKLAKQFELFSGEWTKFSNQLATAAKSKDDLDYRVSRITGRFNSIKNNQDLVEVKEDEDNDI